MKFALKVVGPGVLLFVLSGLMFASNPHSKEAGAVGAFALVWLWISFPVMVVYIIARIWKRATRDSDSYRPLGQ